MLPNWDGARLDFVHANGKIPNYNNELVRFILKNKGMAFGSVDEAVENYKLVSGLRNLYSNVFVTGNSFVEIEEEPDWNTWVTNDKLLGQLSMNLNNNSSDLSLSKRWAVNVYLNGLFGESNGNVTALNSWLDKLNVAANQARVVTPFSSMVALVNFQQLNELKNNMQSYWRYAEDGGNFVPAPMPTLMPLSAPSFNNQWRSGPLNPNFDFSNNMMGTSLEMAPMKGTIGAPGVISNPSIDSVAMGAGRSLGVGFDMNLLILVVPVVLLGILAAVKWMKERGRK